jgi:hypothetical protein
VLAGAAAFYQGFCAFYYRSRREALRHYHEQTPAWIRQLATRLKW